MTGSGRMLMVLIIMMVAVPVRADRMPPGAFLRRPAPSAAALNRQVRSFPPLLRHYARVMGRSPEEVARILRQVRVARLPSTRVLRVYYLRRNGRIGYRVRRVRRGTPVFALPDGRPVLMKVCGNPLLVDRPSVPRLSRPSRPVPDFNPTEPLPEPDDTEITTQALEMKPPLLYAATPLAGPWIGQAYTGPDLETAGLPQPERPVEIRDDSLSEPVLDNRDTVYIPPYLWIPDDQGGRDRRPAGGEGDNPDTPDEPPVTPAAVPEMRGLSQVAFCLLAGVTAFLRLRQRSPFPR